MIDLKRLRRMARTYFEGDEEALLFKAADEIERIRASELALKRELLRRMERLDYYALDVSDGPDIMMSDNEWLGRLKEKAEIKDRIQQLERELGEAQ